MEIIYKKGLCVVPLQDEIIDLSKENILSYQVIKRKGWKSPNLVIVFKDRTFEQPIGMISNYNEVIKYLKK